MEKFPIKEVNAEANGGNPFSGEQNSELTSYSEYDRTKGSDGFSKKS